jgi:hypothetical protein
MRIVPGAYTLQASRGDRVRVPAWGLGAAQREPLAI